MRNRWHRRCNPAYDGAIYLEHFAESSSIIEVQPVANTIQQPVSIRDDERADPCELSVVMPCLNEAETIGVCIEKARAALRQAGIDGEVIVADNGSTDGSLQIAIDSGARLIPV